MKRCLSRALFRFWVRSRVHVRASFAPPKSTEELWHWGIR